MIILPGLLFALAEPANAGSVLGRWRTPSNNGIVQIGKCGSSMCGWLISSDQLKVDPATRDTRNANPQQRVRPLKNLVLLSGFRLEGTTWTGGRIYNPEDGKTYSAELWPSGADKLTVRGCVMLALCKNQTWVRVK